MLCSCGTNKMILILWCCYDLFTVWWTSCHILNWCPLTQQSPREINSYWSRCHWGWIGKLLTHLRNSTFSLRPNKFFYFQKQCLPHKCLIVSVMWQLKNILFCHTNMLLLCLLPNSVYCWLYRQQTCAWELQYSS